MENFWYQAVRWALYISTCTYHCMLCAYYIVHVYQYCTSIKNFFLLSLKARSRVSGKWLISELRQGSLHKWNSPIIVETIQMDQWKLLCFNN